MQTQFSAVLFDLGNVVFKADFRQSFQFWSNVTAVSADEIQKRFRFDEGYAKHERGEFDGPQYHQYVCKMLGVEMSYSQFVDGWNALHRVVWRELFKRELSYFKKVYCSSQIGFRKPEARGFHFILQETNLKPNQVIFVDDLLENIEGAKAVGLQTLYFQDPKTAITELRKQTGI